MQTVKGAHQYIETRPRPDQLTFSENPFEQSNSQRNVRPNIFNTPLKLHLDVVAVLNTNRDDIPDEEPTLGYSIPDEIPTICFQLCELVQN